MRSKSKFILGLGGIDPWEHDAGACLIKGQTIVAYAEEERFVRKKKAFSIPPHNAITYCLESAGISINDLDTITCGITGKQTNAKDVLPVKFANALKKNIPVVQIEHHEGHAASVFYTSPFDEAAVLVMDGLGDEKSTSIWKATSDNLDLLYSQGPNKSLGYLYGAIASYCGFGDFGGGKVMGLAPYGKPRYKELFEDIFLGINLPVDADRHAETFFIDQFIDRLHEHGLPNTIYTYEFDPRTQKTRKVPKLQQTHRDAAASVQALLEQEVKKLAIKAKELTGNDNLCLAGGVAMNCVANSTIQNSGTFNEVFVQPGCEDSGLPLGSALAYTRRKTSLITPYTGPSFSDKEIGKILEARSIKASYHKNIASIAAKLLADKNVIGWFQGGMEYGPRALGNRSILASPDSISIRDRVNSIKNRESWRPFGPSVLAEHSKELFELPHESNYMLRSFQVRKEWRKKLAAIVHVDGSTRPQTVDYNMNPRYHELITAFFTMTGLPAILNTSFNDYDEPIVATPDDALRTFYTTSLDALVIGSYLLKKST